MSSGITNQRIKELRKKKKWNQTELAKKVNVSSQVISNWERGYTDLSHEDVRKLADALDSSSDYLLGKSDEPYTIENKEFDALAEINILLKKYGINQSGFFDIEKWKKAGPEGIRQLENYFQFIVDQAERMEKEEQQED